MKAEVTINELRVGNLVHLIANGHENEPDLVKWIVDDFEFYENRMKDIQPIPLTEEILLSIAQAKPESYLSLSFIFNHNCKIWVDKSNEEKNIWYYVWKGVYIEVEYLHHLQNIHYYLNNFEELTIKSK